MPKKSPAIPPKATEIRWRFPLVLCIKENGIYSIKPIKSSQSKTISVRYLTMDVCLKCTSNVITLAFRCLQRWIQRVLNIFQSRNFWISQRKFLSFESYNELDGMTNIDNNDNNLLLPIQLHILNSLKQFCTSLGSIFSMCRSCIGPTPTPNGFEPSFAQKAEHSLA